MTPRFRLATSLSRAGATVLALAAAARANAANNSGGSSRGSSSAGGGGDDDVPAHMKLGLPDPDGDARGYDANTNQVMPVYDSWGMD